MKKGVLVYYDEGKEQLWKIYKSNKPVGFNDGTSTNWIRVEISSGKYHGHPIKIDGPNGVTELLKESAEKFSDEIRKPIKKSLNEFGLDKNELNKLGKYIK